MAHHHRIFSALVGIIFTAMLGTRVFFPTLVFAEADQEFRDAHRSFFNLLSHGAPDLSLRALYQPDNDEDGGPGSFDLQQYSFASEVASPVSKEFYFRFGFDYDLRLYDFDKVPDIRTSTSSETLHAFSLKAGAGWFANDDLLLTGTFEPGIYSDLDDSLDSEDFQYYARGFAAYRINPGTQLIGGIQYDETFDDEPLLPIIGLRLQSEDGKVHINLTFPTEVKVSVGLEPELEVYGGYFLSGDEFSAEIGRAEDVKVHIEDRRLGAGANYYIDETFGIGTEVGMSLGSHMDFKTERPGQFDDSDLDPAFYISVNLGVTL